MKNSILKGVGFGLTSGTITTLGMMIGLNSGTHSKLAVIGGILTVAVADAFSDAFGMYISEKSGNKGSTEKGLLEASLATFLGKLLFAGTFFIPVLLFDLQQAIYVSIAWALFLLGGLSYWIARDQQKSPLKLILSHWLVAILVVVVTHYLGVWIHVTFN